MKQKIALAFIIFSVSFNCLAQDDSNFSFEAGIDLYYGYDFNKPIDRSRQYVTVAARHNEFNLNWGFIKANYQGDRIRANLGFQAGTYPIFNYANEPSDLVKFISEANAGIKITDKIWIDAGIMPSHIGYENTFSFMNEMYTQAFMTELTPYYSTGVQLTAAITDQLDFKFVVLNGWQNIIETNNGKSVGILLNYRPMENLELNYSNYLGNESTNPGETKIRFYNHFYGKYLIQDNWHAVMSVDYGNQELLTSTDHANIFAILFITQYQINDMFNIAGRIEHFNDKGEILVQTGTPDGFVNTNFGMAFDYIPVGMTKIRFEARYYTSPDNIYNAGPASNSNNLLLVGSIAVNLKKN